MSGNKRAYGYTWDQEVQLGKQSDPQIVQQYGLYENTQLQSYVNRIGQKVLAVSHMRRPDQPTEIRNTVFTFRVLDSPIVNAFALPGGYIYVTRGLLAHLENEAQLAVVLGHEIGHVAARHSSQQAFESQLGQIGLIGGAIIGQEVLGMPAGDLLNLGGTAAQLLFLRYGRQDEEESDALGVQYAAMAGYKAEEGAKFFTSLKRLSAQSGESLPTFMSTHPDPGSREQRIPKLAAEYAGRETMTTVNQAELLNVIDGVVLGDNPRQGFVRNGIFYHPELKFQFPVPTGYQVINQPTQVALVEQNQKAILLFTLAEASSARDAAAKFSGQQGVSVNESNAARTNGLTSYYVDATITAENASYRTLSYFIEYGNRVFTFLGYTTPNDYSTYSTGFATSMQGFKPLADRTILNIQPSRLNVVKADRSAPFRSFLPRTLPMDMTAEQLAILNQTTLDAQIERGQNLKLPE